jgi:hypothetical protein
LDMHIDGYEFGRIVIDGAEYDSDLIIVGGAVQPNWRRKKGHTLSVEDLQTVIAARPVVLIVGCGAYGALSIPEPARQSLQQLNIKLELLNTQDAVERFNELCERGIAVAAAFHLTC